MLLLPPLDLLAAPVPNPAESALQIYLHHNGGGMLGRKNIAGQFEKKNAQHDEQGNFRSPQYLCQGSPHQNDHHRSK